MYKDMNIASDNYPRIIERRVKDAVRPIKEYTEGDILHEEMDGIFCNLNKEEEREKDEKIAEGLI